MDVEPPPPFAPDGDDEPEQSRPRRTQPHSKKPLDAFLAEFEHRLAKHPDQPATDAHLELEARAAGARRPPLQGRPASPPPRADPEPPPDNEPPRPPDASEIEPLAAAPEAPAAAPEAPPATPEAPAEAPTPDPRRRLRGRRHRRRRH
jgi:hypothetical protein